MQRRAWCAVAAAALAGCAAPPLRDPVAVSLVGVDALPGEGLELRLAVKLRVHNPNDAPIDYDGVSVALALRGQTFATGVSGERGQVPRFDEAVLTVPASVSAWAVVRQVIGIASADRPRLDVALRGRLHGTGFGAMPFESSAEVDLPGVFAPR